MSYWGLLQLFRNSLELDLLTLETFEPRTHSFTCNQPQKGEMSTGAEGALLVNAGVWNSLFWAGEGWRGAPSQGLAVLRRGGQRCWLGWGLLATAMHELFAFTGQGCSGAVYFCPAQRGVCVIYEAF